MNEHFLCLNQSKTKILVVTPPAVKKKILVCGVIIDDDSCIRFVESAKNSGVILDSVLSFENQINNVVKSCFNIIRNQSVSIERSMTDVSFVTHFLTIRLLQIPVLWTTCELDQEITTYMCKTVLRG